MDKTTEQPNNVNNRNRNVWNENEVLSMQAMVSDDNVIQFLRYNGRTYYPRENTTEGPASPSASATEGPAPPSASAAEEQAPPSASAAEEQAPTSASATEEQAPTSASATEEQAPSCASAIEEQAPEGQIPEKCCDMPTYTSLWIPD